MVLLYGIIAKIVFLNFYFFVVCTGLFAVFLLGMMNYRCLIIVILFRQRDIEKYLLISVFYLFYVLVSLILISLSTCHATANG